MYGNAYKGEENGKRYWRKLNLDLILINGSEKFSYFLRQGIQK